MLIILGIIIVFMIGFVINYYGGFNIIGELLMVAASISLLISLLFLVVLRYDINAQIQAYHTTVSAIQIARDNGSDLEVAAIQHKIIELNRELAKSQYYNTTIYDIWYPDEIMELKPIK